MFMGLVILTRVNVDALDVWMAAATADTTGQTANRVAHRPKQTVKWEG